MKMIMLVIGKTTDAYLREGIAIYTKRLQHYIPFEMKEIPDVRNAGSLSHAQLKTQEGQLILRQLGANDELLLLDENGTPFSSEEGAGYLEKKLCYTSRSLVFAVGGAFGFSNEVVQRAAGKISLSRMTFSHQMVRLIFTEQLYRAFTIIKGEAYHHP
jgi:23S rRNA (pseudouridine1915-N3)-methyltransferase